MATNASGNAVSTESSTKEKTITIDDPVKVTITVVQGTGDDKSAKQTSGLTSTIEKISDIANAPKGLRSSAEQSITINDPVKVTITVVEAAHDEKKHEKSLSSGIKEAIAGAFKVDKVETSPAAQVEDPVTIPTSQPVQREVSVPSPTPTANDKPADQSGGGLKKQESTSSVTPSSPAANEQVTSQEKTTVTVTEEKKDPAPASDSTPVSATTTTTNIPSDDKLKNEGSPSAGGDSKKTEITTSSSELKTNADGDTKRQESTTQQNVPSDSTKANSSTLLSNSTAGQQGQRERECSWLSHHQGQCKESHWFPTKESRILFQC